MTSSPRIVFRGVLGDDWTDPAWLKIDTDGNHWIARRGEKPVMLTFSEVRDLCKTFRARWR